MKKASITDESIIGYPSQIVRQNYFAKNLLRKILFKRFDKIHTGAIEIIEDDSKYCLGIKDVGELRATIRVHNPAFYSALVFGGSIGAGESYMRSDWTCDNLTDLIRIIIANRDILLELDNGLAKLTEPLYKLFHVGRKNTKIGSKKNISSHYDLSNDFYKLFLDETLAYSCGIFSSKKTTLKEASLEKFDRICKKLRLTKEDHLLEIGTGWGGFAIHAAANFGCKVTTTTISKEQFGLTSQKIKEAGLSQRIRLLFEDYRELKGHYDKLVSIEMIEAVGHQYYKKFFQCCSNLLKPDGLMLLQAITIADQAYEQHKKSVDFIKRHIFPGCCIPSISAIIKGVTSASDMKLFHLDDITPHYATTLRVWRQNFFKEIDAVRKLGFTESFIKMWEFYLCYCEAGFRERYLGDVQMVLTKPGNRHAPIDPFLTG